MIPIEEFRKENQEILDLTEALTVMIDHADLRQNAVFCELLDRFSKKIEGHLSHESRSLYGKLLQQHDNDVSRLASRFMTNTHELTRILSSYNRSWCHTDPTRGSNEDFTRETRQIIHFVNDRIRLENEHLLPALG
jgi:hypothetical protein